ncbi:hypothetical protein FSP39_018210 [Pinctada imbricata]|uniref:ISXO2-like transposase domain-containing protein n=1 Tax=Pinctada imbricata TaxID=66713 RepID=A0AA88YM27_PINIB|nr:hypothetical protein FSP39_018210 [Pinctada imbricata]
MTYKSTAVNWASFVRELFKEYFHRHIRCRKLSGEIEIDESLFGRRVKHNRGNPNKGVKIWVFGMVERSSNTIILYPVQDRSAETMLPLIVRHVEPGSTIYSDGWSAYCELNNLGFMHFTVVHKYAFKKTYRNVETGDIVSVHTNKIEGAWKHAKDHFKKMSCTRLSQFEGHMAEIMWRSDSKGNLYREFFNILGEVYNLRQPYEYLYSTPLFDSWKGISCDPDVQKFDLIPCSDVETESCSSDVDSSEIDSSNDGRIRAISISSDSDIAIAPNREMSVQTVSQGQSSAEYLYNVLSCSSLSSENQSPSEHEIPETDLDTTLVSSPQPHCSKSHVPQKMVSKPRMSTKSVCCPKGFEETKSVPRRSSRKTENPYSRKAYVFVPDSDSDDDFV